jgi:DNA-binding MarR family transcriptional regulator
MIFRSVYQNTSYYDIIKFEMSDMASKQAEDLRVESSQVMESLAEFRYVLRQFLTFSERAAQGAGLQPQQHQLMLQIAGAARGVEPTIGYLAERLGLRHNSVVELSKRCAEAGLVERLQGVPDHRYVVVRLTEAGERALWALSEAHARELQELAPRLLGSLDQVQALKKGPNES